MSQRPVLRSPLKDKTLRNPGQSLDDAIAKAKDDFLEDGMFVLLFLIMLWIPLCQWLFDISAKIMVIATTIAFMNSLAVYLPKMAKGRQNLRRLRQARDGERAVAECLDLLRDDRHRVFHDIVGPNFDIDHVVIGPKGIFTVETKTLNKYVGKDAHLCFDGERVYVGKIPLPDNPAPQAKAQATWFKKLLGDSAGKTFSVKPVVVFPGWFVDPLKKVNSKEADLWVLEPKALHAFLKNEPTRIKPEDVTLAAFHLKRYIRASNT